MQKSHQRQPGTGCSDWLPVLGKCLHQQWTRTTCRLPASASGKRNMLNCEHNWVKWFGCCHRCLPCCCSLSRRKCQSSQQLPAMKYEVCVRRWQYNKPLDLFDFPATLTCRDRSRRWNQTQVVMSRMSPRVQEGRHGKSYCWWDSTILRSHTILQWVLYENIYLSPLLCSLQIFVLSIRSKSDSTACPMSSLASSGTCHRTKEINYEAVAGHSESILLTVMEKKNTACFMKLAKVALWWQSCSSVETPTGKRSGQENII